MNIDTKLAALDRIYEIYEEFVSGLDVACRRYCAHCCTCNVTLTTLEGCKVIDDIISSDRSKLLEKMCEGMSRNRFKPQVTINGLAELCIQGKEPPEELSDPAWGPCPFLKYNQCPVYRVRPFACRCMVSKEDCGKAGCAEIDPWVLTVNNVFLQYIEHIDRDGFLGNLKDVLIFTSSKDNLEEYGRGRQEDTGVHLISNRPIKTLMIPPEHRIRIRPILDELRKLPI